MTGTERNGAAVQDGVTAPALAASRTGTLEPARGGTPERHTGTAVAKRTGTRAVTRTAARYAVQAYRAVPRGSLTTLTAARHAARFRPTDLMCVYRARKVCRFAQSPAAVVVLLPLAGIAWTLYRRPEWIEPACLLAFALVCLLAAWAGWGIADGIARYPHRARWVNELGYALRNVLDISPETPSAAFVHWLPDFGAEGTEMRIKLPRGWTGGEEGKGGKDDVLRAVREIGGFAPDDINTKFVLTGPYSFLQVTPREKIIIPQRLVVTDVEFMEMLEQVRPGRPLLALGGGGKQIFGDLAGDAPHMGFSMRTRGGKSNQLKGIVAQEMHLGASVVILDIKRRSLKCFKGIEGVLYCREIEEIHSALIALEREADNRNRLADDLGDDEEPPWQRRLIVMEEQNSTIDRLIDYWQQIREPSDPRVSPAVRAYRNLLNMGRGVEINILAVFQRLTAQAAGGATARDNFGMVVISKPKPALWKMLVDEIPFPNVVGKPPGRSWFSYDGEAPEGQPPLWTDKAAREWATSGVSSAVRAYDPRGSRTPASQGERPARRAGTPIEATSSEGAAELLYTLRQASKDKGAGVVDMNYQSLRGKRAGSSADPEFPDPDALDGQSKLYLAETLQRWAANREKAAA